MNLLPGCRVAVAPKFHLNAEWASRIRIGAGIEETEGKFFPRGPWREPTPEELALLVAAEPAASAPGALPLLDDPEPPARACALDDHVCLFQIPEHLRAVWWELVETAAKSGAPVQGFDAFAARVAEFLTFKGLDLGSVQMEVLATAPNARSIRVDPTGQPAGLGPTVAPWATWPVEQPAVPRLRAVLNLGDEATGVVLINLALSNLATELARRAPAAPPTTVGELVARFGSVSPDYPPVRLQLGSGEGCRFPADGLILDGDVTGKEEPGVLLLISEGDKLP